MAIATKLKGMQRNSKIHNIMIVVIWIITYICMHNFSQLDLQSDTASARMSGDDYFLSLVKCCNAKATLFRFIAIHISEAF